MSARKATPDLEHLLTIPLHHFGECNLMGVAQDGSIFIEEIYGAEDWIAQHHIAQDGQFLSSTDEVSGANRNFTNMTTPPNLIRPGCTSTSAFLNFSGPRLRGLRQTERINETVHPLPVMLKMKLIESLKLNILPPMLIGLSESYVMSEAQLPDGNILICRRLRFAMALAQAQRDKFGDLYDFDSITIHVAHWLREDADEDENYGLEDIFPELPGPALRRPLDCVALGSVLYLCEASFADQPCKLHLWKLNTTIDAPLSFSAKTGS